MIVKNQVQNALHALIIPQFLPWIRPIYDTNCHPPAENGWEPKCAYAHMMSFRSFITGLSAPIHLFLWISLCVKPMFGCSIQNFAIYGKVATILSFLEHPSKISSVTFVGFGPRVAAGLDSQSLTAACNFRCISEIHALFMCFLACSQSPGKGIS